MTSSRLDLQKSMSKSGIDTLSGFKNLSNNNPNSKGSTSVINNDHATIDPAPDPLPGPTGIDCDLAHLIKSETIKKYPENFIFVITFNSYSSRSL